MSETKSTKANVNTKVAETKARVEQAKQRIADVRNILSEAKATRDQAIADAEKAYSDMYGQAFDSQTKELDDLNVAFAELRNEITSRWSAEQSSLSESRDVAVHSARQAYDETVEATRETFGVGD